MVCEHLETINRVPDAIECFHEMADEMRGEDYMSGPMTGWVAGWFILLQLVCLMYHLLFLSDFMQRCLSAPQSDRDTALNATGDGNASALHASVMSLLKEWVKAKLHYDSWKDVLASAVNVRIPSCYPARDRPTVGL